jgi:hypothetical protein
MFFHFFGWTRGSIFAIHLQVTAFHVLVFFDANASQTKQIIHSQKRSVNHCALFLKSLWIALFTFKIYLSVGFGHFVSLFCFTVHSISWPVLFQCFFIFLVGHVVASLPYIYRLQLFMFLFFFMQTPHKQSK